MASFFKDPLRSFGGRKDNGQQRSGNGSPVGQVSGPVEVKDDSIYWTQERFAKLGVKGSFLPLSVQPKNVGLADWLAHKCSEEYRVLEALIKILQERNQKNNNLQICNPQSCGSMSAGKNYTYTWLNSSKEPVKVPAIQYISLVQRWIVGKLSDSRVFPCEPLTGTSATYASGGLEDPTANSPIPAGPSALSVQEISGRNWVGKDTHFPDHFVTDVKTIFRQMFRIYAHIYHSHWELPFWHLSGSQEKAVGWTDLNSAFCNFIITAKLFVLLSEKDVEPMQRLVDIWAANGTIPKEALRGDYDINVVQSKLRGTHGGATTAAVPAAAPA